MTDQEDTLWAEPMAAQAWPYIGYPLKRAGKGGKDRAATKRHVLLVAKARTYCFIISRLATWHLLLIQGLSVFVCWCVWDSSLSPVPPKGYNFQVIVLTQVS